MVFNIYTYIISIYLPRVLSAEEIEKAIKVMLEKSRKNNCGLKTRGTEETVAVLRDLGKAAKNIISEY